MKHGVFLFIKKKKSSLQHCQRSIQKWCVKLAVYPRLLHHTSLVLWCYVRWQPCHHLQLPSSSFFFSTFWPGISHCISRVFEVFWLVVYLWGFFSSFVFRNSCSWWMHTTRMKRRMKRRTWAEWKLTLQMKKWQTGAERDFNPIQLLCLPGGRGCFHINTNRFSLAAGLIASVVPLCPTKTSSVLVTALSLPFKHAVYFLQHHRYVSLVESMKRKFARKRERSAIQEEKEEEEEEVSKEIGPTKRVFLKPQD